MKAMIFHGWGAKAHDNWFPWLKAELEKKNIDVYLEDLPNSENPKLQEWLDAAEKQTAIDEETILIGHSLGTVLIQRLLERFSVKAAFLVAAFDDPLNIPQLMNFFQEDFDYVAIKTNKITILNTDNDPYIPLEIAQRTAKNLGADLVIFKGKFHLNEGTNNGAFPELRDMIYEAI